MKFGLVAGEASGDLLGAGLIRAIRQRVPDASFEGVAGPAMIAEGCSCWENADVLAVMGLIEPLKVLPRLLKLRRSLVRRWTAAPPDVFIGIDAPDFNLGLELQLRAAGIRTAQYVSPSVWAWRPGRVNKIRRAADRVLCILPFEKSFYDEHGVDAVFVGHPKADAMPRYADTQSARAALGIGNSERVIAVLPGSRVSEVSRLGPVFAEASKLIGEQLGACRFVTPIAVPTLGPLFERQLQNAGVSESFRLLKGESELAMAAADVVLLASGTAALESALLGKPCVAAYKLSALTALILRVFRLLKVDRFTLPNLLTESPQVPEFIQEEATAEALAAAVAGLFSDVERRAVISARFAKLRSDLAQGADLRAADAVLGLANHATKTALSK